MSSGRYAPLPLAHAEVDDDRELDAAFGAADSDNENDSDDDENTPLRPTLSSATTTNNTTPPSVLTHSRLQSVPGTYDFERPDYDQPPPGSPPASSAFPNPWGNSNGVVPAGDTVARPPPQRPSVFRRTIGALLPQHYAPVPSSSSGAGSSSRAIGSGLGNDGVFGNVTAKPSRGVAVTNSDGSIFVVPEETSREQPPSYQTAQLDTAPPYFSAATVSALDPTGLDGLIIEDLPVGHIIIFIANAFISFFFQFVGFLMTYLMHTTHAAKYGSRAGLGMTLIQYGIYSRQQVREQLESISEDPYGLTGGVGQSANASEAAMFANGSWAYWTAASDGADGGNNGTFGYPWGKPPPAITPEMAESYAATRAWIAFFLMAFGWLVFVSSLYGFWRIKRFETSVRSAAGSASNSTTSSERRSTREAIDNFTASVRNAVRPAGERTMGEAVREWIRARRARNERADEQAQGTEQEMEPMTRTETRSAAASAASARAAVAASRGVPAGMTMGPSGPETPAARMERILRDAHMIV